MKPTVGSNPAARVIGMMGGLTKLARAIDAPVTTVQAWKTRGEIPQRYWGGIFEAAKATSIDLKIEDFVDLPEAEEPAEQGETERDARG
ncbi:carph-isopro domain-containing protein [Aquibium microcysteis]|uniref:carph-isopro domain-containing protein n=1 Tax=Aquibium microcysteis TaxID=675281 RepID=UPI00165D0F1B|nr:hypothetical protein [Aquibium microcysteis]